jgi:hypothetical protein
MLEFNEAVRLARAAIHRRNMARAIRARRVSVLGMTVGVYEKGARQCERGVRIIADRAMREGRAV